MASCDGLESIAQSKLVSYSIFKRVSAGFLIPPQPIKASLWPSSMVIKIIN